MIIGVCGRQRAGKDFTADVLRRERGFARVAFADPMRKAMYDLNPKIDYFDYDTPIYLQQVVDELGWDKAKETYPEVRRMLQRFGTEMGRNNFGEDFWLDQGWRQVEGAGDVIVTDCRFKNELARVKQKGFLWRIERRDLEAEDLTLPRYDHASERDWREEMPHVVLVNNGVPTAFPYVVLKALELCKVLDTEVSLMPYKIQPTGGSFPDVTQMEREEVAAMLGQGARTTAAGVEARGAGAETGAAA